MKKTLWKDPILEEIRKVRKSFSAELRRDPDGFMHRAMKKAIKAGFKISPLKPAKSIAESKISPIYEDEYQVIGQLHNKEVES